jgi:hypothetical protein
MKRTTLLFSLICSCCYLSAQKIDSIYFNLYTDSLKKGFYNYINVDGKLSDGTWLPLDATHLHFSANTGSFKGNDLFIDSSYTGDSVTVKIISKKDPALCKQVVIYIRKRGFDEPLKTDDEILETGALPPVKRKRGSVAPLYFRIFNYSAHLFRIF